MDTMYIRYGLSLELLEHRTSGMMSWCHIKWSGRDTLHLCTYQLPLAVVTAITHWLMTGIIAVRI